MSSGTKTFIFDNGGPFLWILVRGPQHSSSQCLSRNFGLYVEPLVLLTGGVPKNIH